MIQVQQRILALVLQCMFIILLYIMYRTGLDGAPLDSEGDPTMKSYSIKVSQADAEMLSGDNI